MCYMSSGQIAGLASAALTGLTRGNHDHLKQKVMEKQMNCNVNAFDNGIGNEDLDAKKVLADLAAFLKVKVDLKQYGPAIAIKSANKAAVIAAFKAEVTRQVDHRLGQQ